MDTGTLLAGFILGYLVAKSMNNNQPTLQNARLRKLQYSSLIGNTTQELYLSHEHLQEICSYGRAGCDSI